MSISAADIKQRMEQGATLRLRAMGYPPDVVAKRVKALLARPLLPTSGGFEDAAWFADDKERRGRHAMRRVCFEAHLVLADDASSYKGAWGEVVDKEVIRGKYEAGEKGERHQRLRQIAPMSFHFMRRVVRAMRVVRRVPLEVGPALAALDGWPELRKVSELDATLERAEVLSLATGACAVTTATGDGHEPRAVAVPADRLSAWRDVVVEHMPGCVVVCDLREPAWPIWRMYEGAMRAGLYDEPAVQSFEGPEYPAFDGDKPIPMYQLYRGISPDDTLLPVAACLMEGTLEIYDLFLQAAWVARVGLFDRLFVAGKMGDVQVAEMDPAVVIGLDHLGEANGRAALVSKLDNASKQMAEWDSTIERRIALLSSQFYDGLEVERRKEAESGYAIKLRSEDKEHLWGQLTAAWRSRDVGLIALILAQHNAGAESGELPGAVAIEPDEITIRYQPSRTAEESAALRKEQREEVLEGMGTVTPVDIVLREEGVDPQNEEARAEAMKRLTRNAKELATLRTLGLLDGGAAKPAPMEPSADEPEDDEGDDDAEDGEGSDDGSARDGSDDDDA